MPRIKYPINLEKLKVLTEETCYWLGFIAADGCLFEYNNGSVGLTIGLNKQDEEHLKKFQYYIEDKRPLYKRETTNSVSLTIKQRELYDLLYSYELRPKKSLTLSFPSFLITEEQKRWWIRGYIDGDGSLSISYNKDRNNYPVLVVGVVGTEDVLNHIKYYMNTEAKLYKKKGQQSFSITLQGNHKVYKFINWLYNDAKIYLERKYEKCSVMNNIYRSFYGEVGEKESIEV